MPGIPDINPKAGAEAAGAAVDAADPWGGWLYLQLCVKENVCVGESRVVVELSVCSRERV
jgi:hypothetical protein